MAMGQNPEPPVNIPIPTKIGSKMGGEFTYQWDPIGFDPQPYPSNDRPGSASSDSSTFSKDPTHSEVQKEHTKETDELLGPPVERLEQVGTCFFLL